MLHSHRLRLALSLMGYAPATLCALPPNGSAPVDHHYDGATSAGLADGPNARAGTIRGRIVAAGTGAPVASAQVQLGTRGALTNDAGVFTFTNVVAGAYTVQVRMIGFERYSRPVTVADGQTADLTIELACATMGTLALPKTLTVWPFAGAPAVN